MASNDRNLNGGHEDYVFMIPVERPSHQIVPTDRLQDLEHIGPNHALVVGNECYASRCDSELSGDPPESDHLIEFPALRTAEVSETSANYSIALTKEGGSVSIIHVRKQMHLRPFKLS